ncbi:MAG TPA: DUF2306 domain-containing protein [Beijerinckiaceae bacterium]|nr:DUF2306 domain-containing protein [Beijerinckiaceae bacterium]
MSLQPLLAATPAIQVHFVAAAAALLSGAAVLFLTKGTRLHRLIGGLAAAALLVTAISSFWIRHWGGYSPIHLLSILTLVSVSLGIWFRRRGDLANHKRWMLGAYFGLIGAGLFTILPGRLMHAVVFGD